MMLEMSGTVAAAIVGANRLAALDTLECSFG